MTNLFERITNQLITRCKEEIYAGEAPQRLWMQDSSSIIKKMRAAISLFEAYKAQYKDVSYTLTEGAVC